MNVAARLLASAGLSVLTLSLPACSCSDSPGRRDTGVGADAPMLELDAPMATADTIDIGPVPVCRFERGRDFRTPRVGDCVGRIAERTFRRAICACTGVTVNGSRVEAFDSRVGPPDASMVAGGASIGANDLGVTLASAYVAGTVTTSGSLSGSSSEVYGDLEIDGSAGTLTTVSRDVSVGGASVNSFTIGRDLIHSPGTSVSGTTVAGETRICDVQVDPPCPCEPALLIDVAAFVADGAARNDNASLGFDPATLDVGTGEVVDIPPGRIYAPSVFMTAGTIRVSGDTVLFIQDDFLVNGSTARLEVAPDAHLDIFIVGDFTLNGVDNFVGNQTHPANVRLYAAASVTDNGVDNVFAGSIYAPNATFTLNGEGSVVFGSIFAQAVTLNGSVRVVYDLGITDASEGCPDEPPGTCTACAGCDGAQACVDGTCGDCRTDADCCAPLICNAGRCEPLLF